MTLLMDMDNILSVEEPEKVCQLFLFNLFRPSVTGIFFIILYDTRRNCCKII